VKPDPTALVIDKDKAIRRLLRSVLEPEGYRVIEAQKGGSGLQKAAERRPDVIILEIALPEEGGLSVLQALREWSATPVLVLSEQAGDAAKVTALDASASDYLVKPFSNAELLIEGDLVANLSTHEISLSGRPVRLTRREEALFYVLAKYAGKVVTYSHLLRSVWGVSSERRIHDLQVLIAQLRKKLGPYEGELLIQTEGHLGYRLLLSEHEKPAFGTVSFLT